MEPTHGLGNPNIALLIDFDNVILGIDDPGFDVELVVNALRERGHIVMGRCYGDWYRHNRHRRKLMEQGLELVETPAFGPVIKNSADIRIALDGFEIAMTQHHIDTFCLVSGDSDFLPLIKKLQYLGKQVLVICGAKFTSDMLRRNCNEFISYENLLAESVGAEEDATTFEGALALLKRAIDALHERGSEVRSSTVKQMMLQLNPVFSERNFGCAQFKQFLDKGQLHGVIKMGGRDRGSGEFYVLLPDEVEESGASNKPEVKPEPKIEVKPVEIPVSIAEPKPAEQPARRGRRQERPLERPAPTPSGSDLFVPAADEEHGDLATTASSLLGRGLRRGRLKFSGKAGAIEATNGQTEPAPAPTGEQLKAALEETADALEGTLEMTPPAPPPPPAEVGTPDTPFPEIPLEDEKALQTSEAVLEAVEPTPEELADAEEKPKKPRTRRPRKKAMEKTEEKPTETAPPSADEKGAQNEKAVRQTAPATRKKAAKNVADANAAGLTIPGQAIEIVETKNETAEGTPTKKPARRRRTTRKKAENLTE